MKIASSVATGKREKTQNTVGRVATDKREVIDDSQQRGYRRKISAWLQTREKSQKIASSVATDKREKTQNTVGRVATANKREVTVDS